MADKPSLLIVDDDCELARMLGEYLSGEDFTVAHVAGGSRALDLLGERRVDLLILDVMMPGLDGLEVLRRLRLDDTVPVLMLTARGQDDDRILGLELGADDYMSKPFNPRELVARVRAILRRHDRGVAPPRGAMQIGSLFLDPAEFSVAMDKRSVRLTSAEFLVLEALARSAGQMLSRAALTEQALGRPLEAFDRSVDTHVSNLRRKLGLRAGAGIEIRSVRGIGYVLAVGAS